MYENDNMNLVGSQIENGPTFLAHFRESLLYVFVNNHRLILADITLRKRKTSRWIIGI